MAQQLSGRRYAQAIFDLALENDHVEQWGEDLEVDTLDGGRAIAEAMGTTRLCILRNHGLLAVGPTIDRAFMRMYNLEKACVTQVQAMATGHELHMPPAEVCERTAQQLNGRKNNQNEWPALLRLLDAKDPSYTS